ncbi:MAG: methyltransferase type 11, partial [Burkholderiales bacterium]|nr:methyltransferase type 11 [Burkholderiales bacterium]
MTRRAAQRALIAATALSYRNAGRFAWHFARGKLAADPVFGAVFARDLIPSDVRLLDLGCGQGLLMAWLLTAQALHRHGEWP